MYTGAHLNFLTIWLGQLPSIDDFCKPDILEKFA